MDRIQESYLQLRKIIEEEKDALHCQYKELEDAKREWVALENKMDKTLLPDRIRLDIGGTIFATSLSTLTSLPNTFFEAMFSGRFPVKAAEDGTFFIDRDPLVFRYILNYLRGQTPNLDNLSKAERDQLGDDASFYNVQGLIELLQPVKVSLKWRKGPNYTLSKNELTATKTGTANWDATAISETLPSDTQSEIKWGVRVVNTQQTNLMVGVAPASVNQSAVNNYQCGWYFRLFDGTLYSQDGDRARPYTGTKVVSGATVVVTLNKIKAEISFTVDHKDYGVAFKNIPTTMPLVASVCFYNFNDSVELVDF